ncbi:MAG: diaminobutyrate acetyltransferase [Cypionkella sp.]
MNRTDHFDNRQRQGELLIRAPQPEDGPQIWRLIEAAGALDSNSLYCNLLQCTHFAETCAVAEMDGEVVGWMSGYVPPAQPDTLFVWQVCVAEAARGCGLGQRLITSVLARPKAAKLRHVDCTITKTNAASWALFRKVARALDADLKSEPHFLRETHLDGEHESEIRVTIGPFETSGARSAKAA